MPSSLDVALICYMVAVGETLPDEVAVRVLLVCTPRFRRMCMLASSPHVVSNLNSYTILCAVCAIVGEHHIIVNSALPCFA